MPPRKIAATKKLKAAANKTDVKTGPNDGTPASEPGTQKSKCAVCEQAIIDGKDQALFCEGTCQQWVHRYCAGIPATLFSSLSSTSQPFYCYACCQRNHSAAIDEIKATVLSLQTEVSELKNALEDVRMRENPPATLALADSQESSVATRNGVGFRGGGGGGRGRDGFSRGDRGGRHGGRGGGRRGRREGNERSSGYNEVGRQAMQGSDVGGVLGGNTSGGRASEKVKVLGVRRVWGTMSICTTGTVQGVIRRICGVSSVHVKRKSRVSPRGKQQWWFVLHDEESTLSDLENKWTSVEVQTSWKLEPCFQPVTSQNPVVTDVAVVSGDASTLVLDNEVSTVATTSIDTAVAHTDPTVFPQSDMETQSLPQSDSSNMEGRERIDDESAESGFLQTSLALQTQADC